VTKLLDSMGVQPRRHNALPRHLSGGEYQRIAVARALSHSPQVVFADEPTGNLDEVSGHKVMNTLKSWKDESQGRTLVLITHNINHAWSFCDHIIVVSSGKIIVDLPKSETSMGVLNKALKPCENPTHTTDTSQADTA
jgi:putative ABC transport system ATP-binding protein